MRKLWTVGWSLVFGFCLFCLFILLRKDQLGLRLVQLGLRLVEREEAGVMLALGCLCLGGWGSKIRSPGPAWATWRDSISKTAEKKRKRKWAQQHYSFVSRGCVLSCGITCSNETLVSHVTVTGKKMARVLCDGPDSVTCLHLWVFRSEGKLGV